VKLVDCRFCPRNDELIVRELPDVRIKVKLILQGTVHLLLGQTYIPEQDMFISEYSENWDRTLWEAVMPAPIPYIGSLITDEVVNWMRDWDRKAHREYYLPFLYRMLRQ